MNPILAAGLFIGVFSGLWAFVMGLSGWYKDPAMVWAFWAVVAIEVFGLTWGLRQTAREGRGWASQVLAGTMMSVIAGIVVAAASLLLTTLLVPEYFSEIARISREGMQRQGRTDAEIARALESSAAWAQPMAQAMAGFTATLITGIVASAAIALVIRARPAGGEATKAT
jgi:hypothetical protein